MFHFLAKKCFMELSQKWSSWGRICHCSNILTCRLFISTQLSKPKQMRDIKPTLAFWTFVFNKATSMQTDCCGSRMYYCFCYLEKICACSFTNVWKGHLDNADLCIFCSWAAFNFLRPLSSTNNCMNNNMGRKFKYISRHLYMHVRQIYRNLVLSLHPHV